MLREEIQKMFNFSLTQDEKIWLKPLKDGAWSKDALRLAGELVEHKSNVLHILSNQIPSKQVIAVSIETTSPHWLTCDVRLISVSGPAMELVVEDVKQIASLLSDPAFLKVFHDASFSVSCLESKGFPVINYTDTIVLAQVLQNHAKGSVSLQYLVNHWLGLTLDIFPRYWVSEQVKLTEDHRLFVLEKVRAIHMLYGVLLEQLSLKHLEVVLDRERRALPAIIELQKNGILFNYFGWQKELSKIQLEIEELSLRIHSLLEDKELNLDAPEQLKKALNNIGIILEGTSDEVLVKYEADYEVILLLRKYRRKRKQLSTFGEKLKKYRSENKITRENFAKQIEISPKTLYFYETGQRFPKSMETYEKIAKVMQCDYNYLLENDDIFVSEVANKYGQGEARKAQALTEGLVALFAGGELSDNDKDAAIQALTEAYWKAKEENKKYGRKKKK